MLLGVAGGRSAISKQAPVTLIAECAILRRKRTAELANCTPSLSESSPKPTYREPHCARAELRQLLAEVHLVHDRLRFLVRLVHRAA